MVGVGIEPISSVFHTEANSSQAIAAKLIANFGWRNADFLIIKIESFENKSIFLRIPFRREDVAGQAIRLR